MQDKIGDGVNVEFERLMEDLRAVVRDGQALLRAGAGRVRDETVTRARRANRYVIEKPYQSLALVFGFGLTAGFVAGLLSARCSSRRE